MTKKHTAVFDDVLAGLDSEPSRTDRAGARFLQRSNRVAERLSGDIEEKTLQWVDPAQCRMWERHNRAYDLLTEDNCRDLIDGIRSQGKQEFPAIVRATGSADQPYEVICGARRHFAITWLRANNYPQFKYLIELRDVSDEEAFRLADIENRDREDLSDYERAVDYLDALTRYYDGSQKDMAARLEMSPAYLSRFLQLARLPSEVVSAFPSVRDIREPHARALKKPLSDAQSRAKILAEAKVIAEEGRGLEPTAVIKRLVGAVAKPRKAATFERNYVRADGESPVKVKRSGRKVVVEFSTGLSDASVLHGIQAYLKERQA